MMTRDRLEQLKGKVFGVGRELTYQEGKEVLLALASLRPEVLRFAQRMEEVLRNNDDKGGWKGMDDYQILERIHKEVKELDEEVERPQVSVIPALACKEAIDVANCCMFLVDIYHGLDGDISEIGR